jgi:recombination protein RecA
MIDLGVEKGIVEKSGAWYAYKGDRIGQGRENAKHFLREQAAVAKEIEARIRDAYGLIPREKGLQKGAEA